MIKFTLGACALISAINYFVATAGANANEVVETLVDPTPSVEDCVLHNTVKTLHADSLLFASFDTDGDCKVDISEFISGRDASFDDADQTQDGSLSLTELQDWRDRAFGTLDASPSYLAYDRDFDQTISRAEFDEMFGAAFNATDKNADGRVAFSELIRVVG